MLFLYSSCFADFQKRVLTSLGRIINLLEGAQPSSSQQSLATASKLKPLLQKFDDLTKFQLFDFKLTEEDKTNLVDFFT